MVAKQSRLLLDETITTERMLAFVRSVLGLASLVIALKLYYEVQFDYRPMSITLLLVLAYSLVMSLITRHWPEAIRAAAIASSLFEVVLITVLIASSGVSAGSAYTVLRRPATNAFRYVDALNGKQTIPSKPLDLLA